MIVFAFVAALFALTAWYYKYKFENTLNYINEDMYAWCLTISLFFLIMEGPALAIYLIHNVLWGW